MVHANQMLKSVGLLVAMMFHLFQMPTKLAHILSNAPCRRGPQFFLRILVEFGLHVVCVVDVGGSVLMM